MTPTEMINYYLTQKSKETNTEYWPLTEKDIVTLMVMYKNQEVDKLKEQP